MNERIGELLVKENLLSSAQLSKAREEAASHGRRLGAQITALGFMDENELSEFVAKQYGVPSINLSDFTIEPEVIALIPEDVATKHNVVPVNRAGSTLILATADPSNIFALDDIKFLTGYNIQPVVASEQSIRAAIETYYAEPEEDILDDVMAGFDDAGIDFVAGEDDEDARKMAKEAEDAPVVKLVNLILTDAIKKMASDIHIEPYEKSFRVRYRIDGLLYEVMKPPLKLKNALTSRLKIMSELDIAERRLPQDGRIKLKLGKGREMDFRVSVLPTLFGEKVVLRLLDKGNLQLDMTKLGFQQAQLGDFQHSIHQPFGMVLVTGPTGSGKTTTLYSCISKVNAIDTNIMTAEDPVEYNLYGVNQVLVRTEIGMTFAAALRAFLRQDPNIIMVGEIRDLETGGIAIKAALTGHLVLSTLHTNSAAETITRLLDMGLEPFNVSSALNLVLAQRLLRRICSACKAPYKPDDLELETAKLKRDSTLRDMRFTAEAINDAISRAPKDVAPHLKGITVDSKIGDLTFFKGKGCDACNGSGLKGRQGAYEVMFMTPLLRKLILQNVGAAEIKDAAVAEGMLTLRMDGMLKVLKGITTLEQVIRETSA